MTPVTMIPRTGHRLLLLLGTLASIIAVTTAPAGIPQPDAVVFGSISLDGRTVTADDTNVTVELRASASGPALRSYRMGESSRAGKFYVLRAPLESAPPLLQPDSFPLGATLHVVVLDNDTVRDSQTTVVSEPGAFLRLDFGDIDSDGDGMSDRFEITYFGSPTGGDPTLDPDNDGRPNAREFIDQTDPLVADGRHPADLDPADDSLTSPEVTAYALAWQLGEDWSVEPLVIPVDYVTRAGALWKGGESYSFDNDPVTAAPLWWVNTPEQGTPPLPAPGQSTASRSAPASFTPAQPVAVVIQLNPAITTLSHALEEIPPAGWIIRNVSHGGRIDRTHNRIKWGPFYENDPRELSYEITPMPGTTAAGVFHGLASFDGSSSTITGVVRISPAGLTGGPTLTATLSATGEFQIRLSGSPNERYRLESSPNLRDWTFVLTLTADSSGAVTHALTPSGSENRFFRALPAE